MDRIPGQWNIVDTQLYVPRDIRRLMRFRRLGRPIIGEDEVAFGASLGVTRLTALWAKGGPEHGSSPMFCYLSGVLRERKAIGSRPSFFKDYPPQKEHRGHPGHRGGRVWIEGYGQL